MVGIGTVKLNILLLMLLYYLAAHTSLHCLYSELSYLYLACRPSQTTFALCILFYGQTRRCYQSSKVKILVTTHLLVPFQHLSFNFLCFYVHIFQTSMQQKIFCLSHKQSCLCSYSIALCFNFHILAACSHINMLFKSSIACPRYTVLFILIFVFPVSAVNNSFENGTHLQSLASSHT